MTWALKTVVAEDPVLIEDHNTYVNGPLQYLQSPNHGETIENTSTYSTSSTSYVVVHANYSLSLTTFGGHVRFFVSGVHSNNSAGSATSTLIVDVNSGAQQIVVHRQTGTSSTPTLFAYAGAVFGLSAGTHTIALKWLISNGSYVATIDKAYIPLAFYVMER